jgi:NodT family efflux transporter outer membrane factor (OMF) lipoprotein
MTVRLTLLAACASVLLGACVHAQKEDLHVARVEPSALGLRGEATKPLEAGWWHAFGDPQLDRIVDQALAHNPTLHQALARVRASGADVNAADAGLHPRFAIDGNETYERFSKNYYIPPPFAGERFWVGELNANINWNLDFWGKQAAVLREARAEDMASRLDSVAARLTVSGSIAQAYLDLYRAYALEQIAQRTLEQREDVAKLTGQRFSAGLDTSIERDLAQARLAEARNALEQAKSTREIAVHALAALAGRGADYYGEITSPQISLDAALPIPRTLPIDLLARRPDVLAARARVDAADAGRKAAQAAFYPDLSLKALVGVQAIGLSKLTEGSSVVYGAGPILHLPIFDSQRLRAAYRRSTAELDLAVGRYNEIVLNAVRQSADQLTIIDSLKRQSTESRERLTAAESAYEVSRQRYGAGLVSQIVLLNAETEVLGARRDIVAIDTQRAVARITLLLTLGGSFDPSRPGEL